MIVHGQEASNISTSTPKYTLPQRIVNREVGFVTELTKIVPADVKLITRQVN